MKKRSHDEREGKGNVMHQIKFIRVRKINEYKNVIT